MLGPRYLDNNNHGEDEAGADFKSGEREPESGEYRLRCARTHRATSGTDQCRDTEGKNTVLYE